MKALRTIFLLFFLLFGTIHSNAQSDSSSASHRALLFADSLLNAFRYNNLNQYMEMSYPGMIRYYGGKKNFEEYIQRALAISSMGKETFNKTEVIDLQNNRKEWQCVIRKTSQMEIDGKRASIISYLVGQSKDEGQNWKYVDVALNSVNNVVYIMPDIFSKLSIPQRQVVFVKDQVAKQK